MDAVAMVGVAAVAVNECVFLADDACGNACGACEKEAADVVVVAAAS